VHIGIKVKLTLQQSSYRIIGTADYAAVELNACLSKSSLCAAAYAAADKGIHAPVLEKARKGAVSAAHGIHNFAVLNSPVPYLINLKSFGMSEVLKYLSVVISYCNFHLTRPFLFSAFAALAAAAAVIAAFTQNIVPAFYLKALAVDKGIRKFAPCTVVNGLHRGTCNIHPQGAFLLCKSFKVNKPYAFKFINRHHNVLGVPAA